MIVGNTMRGLSLVVAGALGLLISSSPVRAETQPHGPDKSSDTSPDQRVHNMDQAMNRYDQPRGAGGYGDRFDDMRAGSHSPFDTHDLPLPEMAATVDASAHAAAARRAFDLADNALGNAVHIAQSNFERSDAYVNSLNDEKKAYEDFEAARRSAIRKISDDPQYRAASELRDQLRVRIAERRNMRGTSMHEILSMAMVKLSYATTATAMEAVASSDDSGYRDAQARLFSAGARVREMRRTFEDRVRTDQDMMALRNKVEEARTARLITAAVFEGSLEISNEALDYVYWRHRTERAHYGSYYDPYGYAGYGGGYGANYR